MRGKRLVLLIAIIIFLAAAIAIGIFFGVREIKKQTEFSVGYAVQNISPVIDGEIIPAPLGGYAGLRLAKRIESDLYASCIAFRDGDENTVLIYSVDSIGLSTEFWRELQTRLEDNIGLEGAGVILNCTHNHTSPGVDSTMDEAQIYRELLLERLTDAARAAIEDLSACTKLRTGCVNIPDLSYIRRFDDGKDVDPSVPIARFSRKDKKDILLINWAAHCDTYYSYDREAVSSDYVGVLRDTLSNKLGMDVAVQMGASGDVNPSCFRSLGHEHVGKDAYGAALAEAISSQLDSLSRTQRVNRVGFIERTVGASVNHESDSMIKEATEIRNLYYADKMEQYEQKCSEYGIENIYEATAIVNRARRSEYEDITLTAASVGSIGFATAPYEMFAKTGADIKSTSPFELTFVMGYSNGTHSYMPAEYAYPIAGYEVYSCRYARGTAEMLGGSLSTMLSELADENACKHNFKTVRSNADYHWLKCDICQFEFTNPTLHKLDDGGFCSVCQEHIHDFKTMNGFSAVEMSCIGSSTTMGAHIERSYDEVVGELLGLKDTHNYGVSWSTVGHKENCGCNHPYLPEDYIHDPMVYRATEMEAAEIIAICGGLNDFGVELPLGDIDDDTPYTFYGALNMLISSIKETYPDSYVFLITGFNYFDGYTNKNGDTWKSFNEAMIEVCEKQGIDCLDVYKLPFNRLTDTLDYVHPTQKFTDTVFAPAVADFLMQRYPRYSAFVECTRCNEIKEELAYENLFVDNEENHGKICTIDLETKKFKIKESPYCSYSLIDVEGMNAVRFAFTEQSPSLDWSYFFYDENDICVGSANITPGMVDVYTKVPKGAKYIGVLYSPKKPYGVYQAG